jgi:ArsR family transcriptional regulator, arsenate/arsenite/antimonite-responsive transcriptional repressor / arsenate reductase (thioredoxin)
MADPRRTRAYMHAALGDPVRLGIAEELARSDRTSSELADRFRMPTNLLAHHLGVLERAGLLLTPSSGDRRRRYVRLRRERLADLHLRTPLAQGRVLFVCTHNAARSQLAAALWRRRTGDEATSAGTRPARRVHPGAVAAARRAGVDIAGAEPRLLEDTDFDADLVVTVCDRDHEQLEASATWLHWSIPDPAVAGTETAFDDTVAALDERIATLTA